MVMHLTTGTNCRRVISPALYKTCRIYTWMIKVELALLCLGFLLWSQHLVETVLAQDRHLSLVMVDLVLTQQLHNFLTH